MLATSAIINRRSDRRRTGFMSHFLKFLMNLASKKKYYSILSTSQSHEQTHMQNYLLNSQIPTRSQLVLLPIHTTLSTHTNKKRTTHVFSSSGNGSTSGSLFHGTSTKLILGIPPIAPLLLAGNLFINI